MLDALEQVCAVDLETETALRVQYPEDVEQALQILEPVVCACLERCEKKLDSRWLSLQLLDMDEALEEEISAYLGEMFF